MPHINIKLYPGRPDELKKKLSENVAKAVEDTIGAKPSTISVAIEEVPKEKWPKVYKNVILASEENLYKKPEYGYDEEELNSDKYLEEGEVKASKAQGGEGFIVKKDILPNGEIKDKCNLFSHMKLEPDSSIGYHKHIDESETYYILSGEGEYNDNGVTRIVKAGDTTFTPNGSSHGLKNTKKCDLEFIALIVRD